jgi:hypothetical protein
MALVCAVVPVRAGQEDRVREFGQDLEKHQGTYDELNRGAGIRKHAIWLQRLPAGWVSVNLFEIDDPSRFARVFDESSDFDRWWLDFVRDVHGIDLRAVTLAPAPPEPTFLWEDTDASDSRAAATTAID